MLDDVADMNEKTQLKELDVEYKDPLQAAVIKI